MTLLINLLSKYWKNILATLVILLACWWIYSTIYDKGVTDTNKVWETRIALQEKVRSEQISSIESLAKVTLEQTLINNDKTRKDLAAIYSGIKGRPTTVIKDGKCEPSEEFMQTYNEIIKRGNQK